MTVLYSIVESPAHPRLSNLYQQLGISEIQLPSMRKAIAELKHNPPDFVVAEFFYGYGNNYAGVNVSNLDVFLYSLQKYAPAAKVIVLVDKSEQQYVGKLPEELTPDAVLIQPVSPGQIEGLLTASGN